MTTRTAADRAERLLAITGAIADAVSGEEVFEAVVDRVADVFDASSAGLWLVDDATTTARLVRARGYAEDARRRLEVVPLDASPSFPALDCIRFGQAIWIGSQAALLEQYPHLRDVVTAGRAYRVACLPLVTHGRVLGTLGLTIEKECETGEAERELLLVVARHASHAVERLRRLDAMTRLEDTIRHNELFAGVLAHDLRNPLGAIMTATQLLLLRAEGAATDREARTLSRILSSGQRMAAMIDQLLDFTRARSGGGIAIEPSPTDLAALCRQAAAELELAHPHWAILRDNRGDLHGTWDADRMLQVVSNLMANAGQHGRRQTPIALRLDGTDPQTVRIEVHNEGVIAASLLPQLFDPFRSSQHRRAGARGLGLGLFIVREIVAAHGGTVQVTSSDAVGTTFSISLPRHCGSATRPVAAASRPASAAGPRDALVPGRNILVVDDDLDVREALAETLEDRGFVVDTAANGREALEHLRQGGPLPAAILLDLMMPIMDGYGFLAAQRSEPAIAAIPVVVITAGHGVDRTRLGDTTPVVPKPIKLPHLMTTLERLKVEAKPS